MISANTTKPSCDICSQPFSPRNSFQRVCYSVRCLKKVGPLARKAAVADRKQTRARLDELRPLGYWLKQAQHEVNRYVRLRDAHLGCVSCPRPPSWDGQWHASHFRSTGAASAVRFHLWNVHKACSICNNWKSGNLSEYEPRLRARIGDAKVDWLRTQNQVVQRTRPYLVRLTAVFRRKANRQQQRSEA